jgi:transcriptional regulator with AAA-type ATPase domain
MERVPTEAEPAGCKAAAAATIPIISWVHPEYRTATPLDRPVLLGRDEAECQAARPEDGRIEVLLGCKRVSGRHARITPRGRAHLELQNLSGTNPVWIDGTSCKPGAPPREIGEGALLRLGDWVGVVGRRELPLAPYPFVTFSGGPYPLCGGPALTEAIERADRIGAAVARHLAGDVDRCTAVLIEGATGTGKEWFAHRIREGAGRAGPNDWTYNCALAIGDTVRAELMGYWPGAFTGAATARAGFFELCDGRAAYLDEIQRLPLDVQPMLNRLVENGEVQRIGSPPRGERNRTVSLLVIAATNQPLDVLVRQGLFRDDLSCRLATQRLVLPPLRERREDVPGLLRRFVQDEAALLGREPPRLYGDLIQHLWPRDFAENVRGLRNLARLLVTQGKGDTIDAAELVRLERSTSLPVPIDAGAVEAVVPPRRDWSRDEILSVVAQCRTKNEAAKRLGMARSTLFERLRAFEADGVGNLDEAPAQGEDGSTSPLNPRS